MKKNSIRKVYIILVALFTLIGLNLIVNNSEVLATATPTVQYNSHIQNIGWEKDFSKSNGELSGTQAKSLRLEAMKIKVINMPAGVSIKYQTHIQDIGWQAWKKDGELSGTQAKSLRLEGIRIKLEGTKQYRVEYRVHIQNLGWQEWKKDGEFSGTEGKSLRLEAIQIRIVPINTITVEYNSHIANVGWERDFSKSNGQVSGTTGKDLGMQAIKIRLKGVPNNVNIEYQAHIQNIGWQNWISEENIAGTTGKSLNIEAIKLKLNNLSGKSIEYRVHVENIGWQAWKKDGEIAGTSGRSLRIEAIEIRIVDKKVEEEPTTKKGIDVSTYQNNIDWQKVKGDGVQFAMIRAGFRGYGVSSDGINGKLVEDEYYKANINGATKAGIDVGVYFFTQAINEKEAIEEANYVLNLVKGYKITYPIAIDTEWSGHPNKQGRADKLTVTQRTAVVKAFCDTIEKAGYKSMIYASKSWFKDNLDITKLSNYSIWLAHYTGATQDDPLSKPSDYTGKYIMWQYTDKGTVDGVLGNVDMNVGFNKARSAPQKVQIIY